MILSPLRLVSVIYKMSTTQDQADESCVELLEDESGVELLEEEHGVEASEDESRVALLADENQETTTDDSKPSTSGAYKPQPQPEPEPPRVQKQKQISAIARERLLMQKKLLEKHSSKTSKIICGLVTILLLFGIGAIMVYLGITKDIRDLFIIAAIFITGATVFSIGFTVVRCTIDRSYSNVDYSSLYQTTTTDDRHTNYI